LLKLFLFVLCSNPKTFRFVVIFNF